MNECNSKNTEELKDILIFLEEIVVVIDKIGSGFDKSSKTATALLLFFNQCNVLDKLAKIRKYLYQELESRMDPYEYNEWIEKDISFWKPPYEKTVAEMLEMLNSVKLK
ncbi:hypothetical protein ACFX2U_11930 [Gilliamella apicola]|uniref:hypothetical protein n=1 Tax=Gilliamella apicola TaxID=1196095 RepID=UPI003985C315